MDISFLDVLYGLGGIAVILILLSLTAIRTVVSTNQVHIVQSSRKTTSYGRGQAAGNTYYKWPSWLPVIGVKTTQLPVSVFDLPLQNYNAYDKGRLPFVIDMMAFFRINDSNMAAERVHSFEELKDQLEAILQGAARTILATSEIEEIMESRGIFGEKFTQEVEHQLTQWGVGPVKNIELMDLRDAEGSKVIANIMAKKKSQIESESRIMVANNNQQASIAEIEAQRKVAMQQQDMAEQVGTRTAQKDQKIGIAQQQSQQAVAEEQKTTAQKQIDVQTVSDVGQANITKQVKIVEAEQGRQLVTIAAEATKQKMVTEAEGQKEQMIQQAEGSLQQSLKQADGIRAKGEAEGSAATAIQMAPVNAQIALAKEIGSNEGYQSYLITIKQVEAGRDVGIEQAKALEKADVRVIANSGNPMQGVSNVMDLFGPKGGALFGQLVETAKATSETVGAALAPKKNGAADDRQSWNR